MEILKERIRKEGKIKEGNVLKVDSFLNHQMDIELFSEIGKEFKRRFKEAEINKILTIEASGIGIACVAAQSFHVPVVFAKKTHNLFQFFFQKITSIGLLQGKNNRIKRNKSDIIYYILTI